MLPDFMHPAEKKLSAEFEANGENFNRARKLFATTLGVMNNAHETITSLAEVPDRSFLVTAETYPRLYELYRIARDTLELNRDCLLFCKMGYNRVAKTLGTDDEPMIVIDSACLDDFSDVQLLAILGRELGHVKLKHVKYLTTLNLIDTLTGFSNAVSAVKGLLYEWTLTAHFSADRAGAIVAGGVLPVVQSNLMTSGLESVSDFQDCEAYLQADMLQGVNNFDRATKILMSNTLREFPMPFVIERTRELILWSRSEECKKDFPDIYGVENQSCASHAKVTRKSPEPLILCRGQRLKLRHQRKFTAVFEWESAARNVEIDLALFLTDESDKVANDDDVVFFNNVRHKSGAVALKDNGSIDIDLSRVPKNVKQLSVTASIYDADKRGQNFGMIRGTALKILVCDTERVRFPLESFTNETAIVLGEFYRSKDEWKFIAIGTGREDGFAALCESFGVKVEPN